MRSPNVFGGNNSLKAVIEVTLIIAFNDWETYWIMRQK